jgi:hypothetical protein
MGTINNAKINVASRSMELSWDGEAASIAPSRVAPTQRVDFAQLNAAP